MSDKSPKRKSNKKRTCFVSATSTADLSAISSILHEKGIQYVAPYDLPAAGLTIFEKITDAISNADLFIAVLNPEQANANAFFELGYAYALKKLVLIIVPPEVKSIPFDIQNMLYIRAEAKNREALSFALDQLLAAPEGQKRRRQVPFKKSKPLGARATELITRLESLGDNASEHELLQIVEDAVLESGMIAASSKGPEARPDIAVWADDLEAVTGNPLIIEIKKQLASPASVTEIRNKMLHYMDVTNSRAALVLYAEGEVPTSVYQSLSLPFVYFFQIRELLNRLKSRSFGEVIQDKRNEVIHGRNY